MRALTMQQWNSICDGVFSGYVFTVYLSDDVLRRVLKKWTWTKKTGFCLERKEIGRTKVAGGDDRWMKWFDEFVWHAGFKKFEANITYPVYEVQFKQNCFPRDQSSHEAGLKKYKLTTESNENKPLFLLESLKQYWKCKKHFSLHWKSLKYFHLCHHPKSGIRNWFQKLTLL